MYQIDNPSAATSMPTPKPAGPPGFFTQGNVNTGQDATIVEADFLNTVQQELVNVVQKGGLTLDKSNNSQLLLALSALFTAAMMDASVTQGIPVPAWASHISFRMCGGGGGGAHCQNSDGVNYTSGGGGGSGGYSEAQRPVTPGEVLQLVIGIGGAEETVGTASSLTSIPNNWVITANGGQPAHWDAPTNCHGGQGGTATGGDLNVMGSFGGDGEATGNFQSTGYGGPGPWGGGPRAGQGFPGAPGQGPGAGGGGVYDSQKTGNRYSGGVGANGLMQYRFLP